MKRIKTTPIKPKLRSKSLTEQMVSDVFGPDAVVGQGMMLVGGGRTAEVNGSTFAKLVVGGIFLAPEDWCGDDQGWQRWDCDVILVPKKKLAKNIAFKGSSLDMYLTGNGLTVGWTEQIYPTRKSLK